MDAIMSVAIRTTTLLARQVEEHDHDHDHSQESESSGHGHSHGGAAENLSADELAALCGGGSEGDVDSLMGLRIAAIFIIFLTALAGTLFPILARRSRLKRFIPEAVFDFAKYFGSGVIIATAFIHLLFHAIITLDTPCLGSGWHEYPWALAICMISVFALFFVELIAFRWGSARLTREATAAEASNRVSSTSDLEKKTHLDTTDPTGLSLFDPKAFAQVIGIFILEFGILLHSVLIGLMLAVSSSSDFKILLVVLVFHQTFEGLGLGARLSLLTLHKSIGYVPVFAAILYALSTPIGIAAGLGVRSSYNPHSSTASAVSGIMDSITAGVLLYTGLVELLAHEFLFNRQMLTAPTSKLVYACACMALGAAMMSLLGRWA